MPRLRSHRRTCVAAAVVLLAMALTTAVSASAYAAPASAAVTVDVSGTSVGAAVPAGFVGLATEYPEIEGEVGTDPTHPDAPFEQLVRNLAPYGGLSLRIGGDSTDWAWWPVPGMKQPPWVRWTITPTWVAVTKRLASDLHAHLIIGVNMEADNTKVASTEVRQLSSRLGNVPTTYEVGNEPELYSKFPFYTDANGRPVYGRSKDYSATDITAQWNQIAAALPHVPLAGPGYATFNALPDVAQFLDKSPRLSLLTVHSYPLRSTRCGGKPQESHLFAPAAIQVLASEVSSWTSAAREHSVPVRVDEMNSVTCGGMPKVSNAFGPALWALNILPLYAEAGLAGVNFQTRPFSAQNLIQAQDTHSGWRVQLQPEYYGLLAFATLTPPGSRILQVSSVPGGLYAWAVRTPQGQTHVVLTNVTASATTVGVQATGATHSASLETLRSASGRLQATAGVTLGGQTISPVTGRLTGTPVTTTIPLSDGTYNVKVAAASAAIITFKG